MKRHFEKISVVGLGYVGLPTAATIAARGVEVVGVDVNGEVVQRINEGKTHIVEPDLDIIVSSAVSSKRLRASTEAEQAEAFLICVPTPLVTGNRPDLSAVLQAVRFIAPVLMPGNLVIIESTSPVGTTEMMAKEIRKCRPDLTTPLESEESDIKMAYCPERILPGATLRELTDNARIIGGLDEESALKARELYSLFVTGNMYLTDTATAEMSKLTENAYRDTNIAFANEISMVCDHLGLDVSKVIDAANQHPRVNILDPGPGVGGHCIPIDPWFIIHSAEELTPLLKTARQVNVSKSAHVIDHVRLRAERFKEPVISVLGLSYKPNIDDLRESPAVKVAGELAAIAGVRVLVGEPHIDALPAQLAKQSNISLVEWRDAIRESDIVVVLVSHDVFRTIDPVVLSEKILIDTVGLLRKPLKTAFSSSSNGLS